MSLVVAHRVGDECQVWSSDGLVVETEDSGHSYVSKEIDKIYRLAPHAIAIGFSGNCYDASEILRLTLKKRPIHSMQVFLNEVSESVAKVNQSSQMTRLSRGLPIVYTGLIVGGFLEGHSSLFVINPSGQIIHAPAWAAIGAGLSVIESRLAASLSGCSGAEDSIASQGLVFEAATMSGLVGKRRQTVVVSRSDVTGCPELSLAQRSLTFMDAGN